MWPLPPLGNEYITLYLTPQHMSCGWIQSSQKHSFILKAYESHEINRITSNHLAQTIASFIKKYRLFNSTVSLALSSALLYEQFIRLSHASATAADFLTPALKKMIWEYRYLHAGDIGDHIFYVCGLEPYMLFNYQLLMHTLDLHLVTLTSSYSALIQAYCTLFGAAYRKSRLALDMIAHDYKVEQSMGADSIARFIQIEMANSFNITQEKIPLLTFIGLYNQERKSYATNQFYKK